MEETISHRHVGSHRRPERDCSQQDSEDGSAVGLKGPSLGT